MSESNNNQGIIIAIIGLVGVIATAVIANWDKFSKPPAIPQVSQSATGKTDSSSEDSSHAKKAADTVHFSPSGADQHQAKTVITSPYNLKPQSVTSQTKQSTTDPAIKYEKGYTVYANFPVAYREIFRQAATNFVSVKGNLAGINYLPKVIIQDKSASPSNIFFRSDEWAFRFVIEGAKEEEQKKYSEIDNLIEITFVKNDLKYQKKILGFGKGDVALDSYEYTAPLYRVEFTRIIDGMHFMYEVIIYHSIQ